MSKEAMELALEALEGLEALLLSMGLTHLIVYGDAEKAITALREALAEQAAQQEPVRVPVTDNTYNYAKSLAEAIFKQHFASDEHYASGRIVWGVNDTVLGILTQIDNMVSDMVRKPHEQQEPVAWISQSENLLSWDKLYDDMTPLYLSPPAQRKPLTDDQIYDAYIRSPLWIDDISLSHLYAFARAIEAAHGIKENT